MEFLERISLFGWIYIVLSYLLGAMPTGYIVVKRRTGKDVREFGSGNTGATNVKRVAGSEAARMVLAIDFFKGFLPVMMARILLFPDLPELHVMVAIVAIVGHSKSVFLGFTGGKSAATGLGTLVGLVPVVGLIVGVAAFGIIKLSRIVSVGSMSAAVLTPLLLFAFNKPLPYIVYGLLTGVYVIFLHRENIKRLIQGTENRLE